MIKDRHVDLRTEKKAKQVIIENTIKAVKHEELDYKQGNAASMYRERQQQGVKSKYAKDHLLESIQRVHN